MSFKEDFMILYVLVKVLLWQQKRNGAGGERRDEGTRGRLWQLGAGGSLAGPVSSPASPKPAFLCCRGCRRPASSSGSGADKISPVTCILDIRMVSAGEIGHDHWLSLRQQCSVRCQRNGDKSQPLQLGDPCTASNVVS